jgi:L-seryl-tRNA(Ser) seleniumtransferase/D-glucosaminate-6-phosphate ammonia-lyase
MTVYQDLGLKRVINASGRVTVLGVSTFSDRVAELSRQAGQSYVVVEDLMTRAGELISEHTGAEMSCVASCASAAIALSVAGLVTKGRYTDMMRLPDSSGLNNEIVLQKGHSINYGAPIPTMIRLGGGVPVEVGQANEVRPEDIEEGITDKTVALLYVKSHHCVQKGMVDIATMRDIAHAHGLPFMMDCAAEEDFRKYITMGADLVCYSGAKALEATTSGFVTGKREYVQYVQPQYKGIGRAMKVGKEQIVGLLEALDQYDERDVVLQAKAWEDVIDELVQRLDAIDGIKASKIADEAGRAIFRCRIEFDGVDHGVEDMYEVDRKLKSGDPIIWGRTEFLNLGKIDFDARPLGPGDVEAIEARLREIMEEINHAD